MSIIHVLQKKASLNTGRLYLEDGGDKETDNGRILQDQRTFRIKHH